MVALFSALRTLVIAAATAGAAFGLLTVFHPFAHAPVAGLVTLDTAGADALHARIDAARAALAQTDAALDNVNATGLTVSPSPDGALRAQYEAQIAAATERRDLALRHAAAIRAGLEAGMPVASLAEIRDSVVIGQLLSQQAALEGQIAEQGARFKASHPVMRALLAQRGALAVQIRAQAASIAAALESEAVLDDKQIKLLQSQLVASPANTTSATDGSASGLQARAAAQRTELDALMDAYFKLAPTAQVTPAAVPANPLNPLNLFVVGIAGIAALVFQVALALRRRRAERAADDLGKWQSDHDEPELPLEMPAPVHTAPLRRAS